MEYTETTHGKVMVFHLSGKIMGGPEAESLCLRLEELIRSGTKALVMDFHEVRWINSTGIGMIIACLNNLRKHGGDVHFAMLHDATAHYFHLTKIESVVKIFDTVEAAVAGFADAPDGV